VKKWLIDVYIGDTMRSENYKNIKFIIDAKKLLKKIGWLLIGINVSNLWLEDFF
jgi:hypothetical protein